MPRIAWIGHRRLHKFDWGFGPVGHVTGSRTGFRRRGGHDRVQGRLDVTRHAGTMGTIRPTGSAGFGERPNDVEVLTVVLRWLLRSPGGGNFVEKSWKRLLSPKLWSQIPATAMAFDSGAWAGSDLRDEANLPDVELWSEVVQVGQKTSSVGVAFLLQLWWGSVVPDFRNGQGLPRLGLV